MLVYHSHCASVQGSFYKNSNLLRLLLGGPQMVSRGCPLREAECGVQTWYHGKDELGGWSIDANDIPFQQMTHIAGMSTHLIEVWLYAAQWL